MSEDGTAAPTASKARDPQSDWERLRRFDLSKPLAVSMPMMMWLNIVNALLRSIPKRQNEKNYEHAKELARLGKLLDDAIKDALAR